MAKPKTYTYKEVELISRRACDNVLLGVVAVLVDRYKFRGEKLEKFMKEVAFTMNNRDLVNRQELKDIILKYVNAKM